MRKRIVLVLVLAVLAAAGAFADLALGLNGALYMDDAQLEAATGRSVLDSFKSGEGIYYGLMGELMGRKLGFGLAYMASFYESAWGDQMVDMDLDLYLAYHILGSRFVIDPLVEAGLGYIFKDYADEAADDDPDNPLTASTYWYLGAGLGVNLGPLGIYAKFIYHFPLAKPVMGQSSLSGTELEAFAIKPYKIELGAKIMFPLFPGKL